MAFLYDLFTIVFNNIKESHWPLTVFYSFSFFVVAGFFICFFFFFFSFTFNLADNEYWQGFVLVGTVLFCIFLVSISFICYGL